MLLALRVGRPSRSVCLRGERAKQKHKLPTLLFRQALFEGRHGALSAGDFVEKLAVALWLHVSRIRQVRRDRLVFVLVGSVSFARLAVTVGTLIPLKCARGAVLVSPGYDRAFS